MVGRQRLDDRHEGHTVERHEVLVNGILRPEVPSMTRRLEGSTWLSRPKAHDDRGMSREEPPTVSAQEAADWPHDVRARRLVDLRGRGGMAR
jgi:hypothetical protein